jgi:hypothetical protein
LKYKGLKIVTFGVKLSVSFAWVYHSLGCIIRL